MNVSLADIRNAVIELGLQGKPVCIHSSLRSFGWVDGGAAAIIEGFLVEGCTLLVPTFSDAFKAGPIPEKRVIRNGCNYDTFSRNPECGKVFSTSCNEIDKEDMGLIPATVLEMEGRLRGNHPLNSFTAIGPFAGSLISEQDLSNVYAPLKALTQERGSIILMGVGLDEMTFIHYAEQMSGRNPFIRWANGPQGKTLEIQAGGCSHGFSKLESILFQIMRTLTVGNSLWKVFPAKESLQLLINTIQANPHITHCGNPACERCNDAILGGPIV